MVSSSTLIFQCSSSRKIQWAFIAKRMLFLSLDNIITSKTSHRAPLVPWVPHGVFLTNLKTVLIGRAGVGSAFPWRGAMKILEWMNKRILTRFPKVISYVNRIVWVITAQLNSTLINSTSLLARLSLIAEHSEVVFVTVIWVQLRHPISKIVTNIIYAVYNQCEIVVSDG